MSATWRLARANIDDQVEQIFMSLLAVLSLLSLAVLDMFKGNYSMRCSQSLRSESLDLVCSGGRAQKQNCCCIRIRKGACGIRMDSIGGQWARPPNSYRSTDANLRPWPLARHEPESRLRSGPDHSLRQSLPQMMGQNRNKANVESESRTLFPLAFSELHNKLRPAFVRQVEMALGKVNFLWMRSLMIC